MREDEANSSTTSAATQNAWHELIQCCARVLFLYKLSFRVKVDVCGCISVWLELQSMT